MDLRTVTMDNLSDLLQNILDKADRDEWKDLVVLTDIDKEAIKMARDRLSPTFKPSSYSYPNNLLYEMGFDVENTNVLIEDIETAISLCLSGTEQEFIHRYYRDGNTYHYAFTSDKHPSITFDVIFSNNDFNNDIWKTIVDSDGNQRNLIKNDVVKISGKVKKLSEKDNCVYLNYGKLLEVVSLTSNEESQDPAESNDI